MTTPNSKSGQPTLTGADIETKRRGDIIAAMVAAAREFVDDEPTMSGPMRVKRMRGLIQELREKMEELDNGV